MAGITLGQYAQVETEPLKKGVFMNLIRETPILEKFPFDKTTTLTNIALRYSRLPTGGAFRKLNTGYTTHEDGQVDQVTESIYFFGGDITYDKQLAKLTNTVVDPIALQIDMRIQSMSCDLRNYLINGDHATDADGFEGIKKRIAGMPSRQTIYAASSASAGLDVTASTGNARTFFNKFDEAFDYCSSGKVDAIIANETMRRAIRTAARYVQFNANLFDVTKDMFGRNFYTWNGVPIYDMGLKADQSTEVITLTEAGGTGSANTTSVYFVSFDQTQGIRGLQLGDFQFYDPLSGGEMESKPSEMRRLDWAIGLCGWGSYGATRLRNILTPASWTA